MLIFIALQVCSVSCIIVTIVYLCLNVLSKNLFFMFLLSHITLFTNICFLRLLMVFSPGLQSLDTEALGLLSWLASSQAVEDFSVDDELVHEAILSPLLAAKSYKEALEMAHVDYESASQQECQDILDSLDGVYGFEGSKKQVSCSINQGLTGRFPSVNDIPQVDGSFDDDFKTSQKDHLSDANTTSEKDKYSANQGRWRCRSTGFGSKHKRRKPTWGPLPFTFNQEGNSEPVFFKFHHDEETKSDSECSFSSASNGDRYCDSNLRTYDQKGGKSVPLSSLRDLMRTKRSRRFEQSHSEALNNEKMDLCSEKLVINKSKGERCNVIPQETQNIMSCSTDQDGVVQENVACLTPCTHHTYGIDDQCLHVDSCSLADHKSLTLSSDQATQSNTIPDECLHFQKKSIEGGSVKATTESQEFAGTDPSMPQVKSSKFPEPSLSRNPGDATGSSISRECLMPDISEFCIKSCDFKSSGLGLEFHEGERQLINEPFMEKVDTCKRTVHVEYTSMDNISEYKSNQDIEITARRCLPTHFNITAELGSMPDANVQKSQDGIHGKCRSNPLNPDREMCTGWNIISEASEYLEMTFSRKPPSRDIVGKCLEDAVTMGHADNNADVNSESLTLGSCFIDLVSLYFNPNIQPLPLSSLL